MTLPHPILQAVLAAVALIAAITDLRTRTIPNWLTLGGLAVGMAAQIAVGGGVVEGVLGLGAAVAVYFPLWLLRAMGGGDLKLMAALGAAAGPRNWFAIFLITSLVGLPIALGTIAINGRLGRTLRNIGTILWQLARFQAPHRANPELDVAHPKSVGLPHGAVIALGVALFLLLARIGATR